LQFFDAVKAVVLLTVLDNGFGFCFADAGQSLEFFYGCAVMSSWPYRYAARSRGF
jgi:hypothetical protein